MTGVGLFGAFGVAFETDGKLGLRRGQDLRHRMPCGHVDPHGFGKGVYHRFGGAQ